MGGKVQGNSATFTILVLSWAAANFYHVPCPAFTILLSIFVPTRQPVSSQCVYTAVPTNFPNFPQPSRHCLTHLATPPRLSPRSSASRAPRASSPPSHSGRCEPERLLTPPHSSEPHPRGSGTGPALTGVIDQGRSAKVGSWFEAVSK